jgi:hypothetical protein
VILKNGKGTEADLAKLLDLCDNIMGRSFCALGDGATSPITSSIKYFRDEYIAHLTNGACPFDPVDINSICWGRCMTRLSTAVVSEMITVVIDGFEVSVPKGTLLFVLQSNLEFRFHVSAITHFLIQLAHVVNVSSTLKSTVVHFQSHKLLAQFR